MHPVNESAPIDTSDPEIDIEASDVKPSKALAWIVHGKSCLFIEEFNSGDPL